MIDRLTKRPAALIPAKFATFVADFVGGSRRIIVPAAAFTILGALTEGFGLVLLLPLVNVVSGAAFGNGTIDRIATRVLAVLPGGSAVAHLAFLLAIFALVMALRGWAIINRDILLARLQTGFVEDLRMRVVDALARADWAVVARLRHGRVAHVLSNDIRSCGLAAQLSLQSIVAAAALIVQLALALLLSPAVASIVILLLGAGAITLRPALRRSRQLGVELTEASFRLTDDTAQFLGGLKLAFSQNLQHRFTGEFGQTVMAGSQREVAFAHQRSKGQVALTSLAAAVAGVALLLGFGVFATSPAALVALLVVLARMSAPAAQIQQNLHYVAHSLPAYEQIGLLRDELVPAAPGVGGAALPAASGDIVFTGVSYSHGRVDGRDRGVDQLDLTLRPGEIVGITGTSGAGKTTLLDLLVGLLVPDGGSVTVGGVPLDASTVADWRDRLSYVSQDPYLFHDTIAGNLLWADPGADTAALWAALSLAGADALVAAMPDGLQTMVGERGTRLSGGERQRIALARALMRAPALLILDEATNAIDVDGERDILGRLAAMSPRPTIIMVAHRAQSLAFCDRLLVLDRGRLIERSTEGTR